METEPRPTRYGRFHQIQLRCTVALFTGIMKHHLVCGKKLVILHCCHIVYRRNAICPCAAAPGGAVSFTAPLLDIVFGLDRVVFIAAFRLCAAAPGGTMSLTIFHMCLHFFAFCTVVFFTSDVLRSTWRRGIFDRVANLLRMNRI